MFEFDIGKFVFPCDPKNHVLDTIASHDYFNSPIAKQLHRFLRETNADYLHPQPIQSCRNYSAFEKICEYLHTSHYNHWYCHMSAPFFALMHEGFDFFFGFAQEINGDICRTNTAMMHSFVVSHEGDLYDPHLEAIIKQHQHAAMEDFGGYFGTKIPANVALSIFCSVQEESVENFWGYLLEKILICPNRTDWFINVINNDGAGWKLV